MRVEPVKDRRPLALRRITVVGELTGHVRKQGVDHVGALREPPRPAIWYARLESAGALLFSFFINLAVVATNASKFFDAGCAELKAGPYACLSPRAFNLSGDNMHTSPDGQGKPCILPHSSGGELHSDIENG